MPPQEQAELWMALRDRMKADWSELTLQEKKAGMCCNSFQRSSMATAIAQGNQFDGIELGK